MTGGQHRQQCKFRFPWCLCLCWILRGREFCFFLTDTSLVGVLYRGPYLASYRARTFLQRPQSFLSSDTCCRSAAFSRSRKEARTVIWFSFSRRASRERFAATLFFFLLDQYLSSCRNECESECTRTDQQRWAVFHFPHSLQTLLVPTVVENKKK